MSKYLYLLDAGHGGLIDGKYQTSGKRSPKFDDGSILYEGVNNRDNVARLIKELRQREISCLDIVNTNEDISLGERVRTANKLNKEQKCIYLSMHSNASGNGKDWGKATGNGVYIYPTCSKITRKLATYFSYEIGEQFAKLTNHRGIRERNFYVLRKTNCPAILFEMGFHDHKEESKLMLTEKWKETLVSAICDAIVEFENSL